MKQIFQGSINLTKLIEGAKSGNVGIWKANQSGDAMVNIVLFTDSDNPDQYGNHGSIKLNAAKDKEDPKIYVGSLKIQKPKEASTSEMPDLNDISNLPF